MISVSRVLSSLCNFGHMSRVWQSGWVIFLLVMSGAQTASSQLCSGSLGENIFIGGDFGSGTSNILQSDPGLAPGYIYTTQVPPDDGFYTITNDMSQWTNIFNTWIPIQDNSSDPFGYMMVVNASFNPGIFFEQIVEGLCENTVYEFSADVINVVGSAAQNHIFPDLGFFIDDNLFYTTGPIPQNETWQTVGFTFQTGLGQESVKLTLRNNAPGGIGNDLALDNISFRACGPSSEVTTNTPGIICEDATFPTLSAEIEDSTSSVIQWQISTDSGASWNDLPGGNTPTFTVDPVPPGNYIYRFVHATSAANLVNEKCRVISDYLELEVVPLEYLIVDTLCEGLSYLLGDEEFDQTGVYEKTFTSSIGCDSIVTLDLTIREDPGIIPLYDIQGPSCFDGLDGLIKLESVTDGGAPFQFGLAPDELDQIDSLILPSGDYTLYVSDRYGCSHAGEYEVPVTPLFVIGGLEDTTLVLGHEILLDVQSNYPIATIEWEPAVGLSCTDCEDPVARPFGNTVYHALTTNENGCQAETSVRINIDRKVVAYCPNVFTPNADGVNDVWGVSVDMANVIGIKQLRIFDRWGGTVQSLDNVPIEAAGDLWDGTINGKDAPLGVYTYLLSFELADGSSEFRNGTITVIK